MEFDIDDEWINVELHPETPPDGVAMSRLFPTHNLDAMRLNLQAMGSRYSIQFGKASRLLPNTKKVLQAGEFAKACGKFEQFHEKAFYAYFVAGKDIGDLQVLNEIGREAGLDITKMQESIAKGEYLPALEKARADWLKYGTTGIPTFVINGNTVIVGAQPIEEFRKMLEKG